MIVVKLAGGLGNQMFQYAAGRALSCKYDSELILDTSFLLDRTPRKDFVFRSFSLDVFNLQFKFSTDDQVVKFGNLERFARYYYPIKRIFSKNSLRYFREYPFSFDNNFFSIRDDTYIEGFWQSEMYFKDIENLIRSDFEFKQESSSQNIKLLEKIEASNSVCLNVRRGDFVSNPKGAEHHGHCSMKYFNEAIQYYKDQFKDIHFFVFSDDIEWCKQNFTQDIFTIVGHEYAGYAFGQYLFLMTKCKHYIIPNSSFAWWAAWLNTNENKIVIAPEKWYNNPKMDTSSLIPDKWIRI